MVTQEMMTVIGEIHINQTDGVPTRGHKIHIVIIDPEEEPM